MNPASVAAVQNLSRTNIGSARVYVTEELPTPTYRVCQLALLRLVNFSLLGIDGRRRGRRPPNISIRISAAFVLPELDRYSAPLDPMLHLLRQQSIGSFTVKVREELDFREKKGSDLYFDMRAQHCTCHYEHDDRTFWPPSTKAPSTIWYSGRYKTLPPDDTPSMCTRAVIASTSGGQLSALTRTVNRLPVSATTNTSFLGTFFSLRIQRVFSQR
jgi:hypothetical protein